MPNKGEGTTIGQVFVMMSSSSSSSSLLARSKSSLTDKKDLISVHHLSI